MSPCPFCGKPPLEKLRRLGSTHAASYARVCSGCRAIGPLKPSPAEAEAAWDNRTLGRAERGLAQRDQPAPTETETGPESLADYELWLERKRAAQTAGPFDPRTMLAADNFLAEPAPTETGPSHLAALSKYSVEQAGPCGGGDGDPGPSSQRRYESDYEAETEPAPQGAPPMLCLAKSKECGGRPCMLPMGHEGNHANWDCDPVER